MKGEGDWLVVTAHNSTLKSYKKWNFWSHQCFFANRWSLQIEEIIYRWLTFNFLCKHRYTHMQFSLHNFFPFSVQCSMVPPSGFSRYTCKSYFLYYPFELSLTACTSCALSFGFFLSYATKDSFIYSLQYGYGSLEENT